MNIEKYENHGALVSEAAHDKDQGTANHGSYVSAVAHGTPTTAQYTTVPEPGTLLLLGMALLMLVAWRRRAA